MPCNSNICTKQCQYIECIKDDWISNGYCWYPYEQKMQVEAFFEISEPPWSHPTSSGNKIDGTEKYDHRI